MATNLLFYNSSKVDSVLLMGEYCYKNIMHGDTLTIKDVKSVSNASIGTYISNLVSATYTEIMIACDCEASANSTATDTLNLANQYALLAKLVVASQGTLSVSHENADTHTAQTIGLTGLAWEVNDKVGTPDAPIYVVLTGGTGSGQLSTIKSNTAEVATIYGTFYAAPDGTTDFKTLTGAKLFVVGQAQTLATVTKNRAELGWAAMFPGVNTPLINYFFAGTPGFAEFTGVADSFGAKALTDSALGASTDQWADYSVCVYDGTTNGYQYGTVATNSSTVLTLSANWPEGTPTGTPTYRIFDRAWECLKDIYAELYIMTNLKAVNTNSTQLASLVRLIDNNGKVADGTAFHTAEQDLAFLDEILNIGKTYLDYLKGGHTLYVP